MNFVKEYMQEIGFESVYSFYGLTKCLEKRFGLEKGREVDKTLPLLKRRSREFYDYKNSDPYIAKLVSEAFDFDNVQVICNWIVKNEEFFGNTILEVGCDWGFFSCFLAKLFPESKITAIDCCSNAVRNARALAKQAGVCNVEFVECDLRDLKGTYNTVFSCRTIKENYDRNIRDSIDFSLKDLPEQAELYRDSLRPYCKALRRNLAEHGKLICFEDIGRGSLLLGWIEAMLEQGLVLDLDKYSEVAVRKDIGETVFHTFVASCGGSTEIDPLHLYHSANSRYVDYSGEKHTGWDAKIVFDRKKGVRIKGYSIENKEYDERERYEVWTNREDEKTLLSYYKNSNEISILSIYDISNEPEMYRAIQDALDVAVTIGGIVQEY